MNIKDSVKNTVFAGLVAPTDRVRASNFYIPIRHINDVCKAGKSLPAEQLEWLTDAIKDKTKEMYPDRYTDLSTPLLRDELNELEKEKKQVSELLAFLEECEKQTQIRLPQKTNVIPGSDLYFDNQFDGM